MSEYAALSDKKTHSFIVSDVKDFIEHLDRHETFVAYFGFVDCPWCNDAINILNNEAVRANRQIYYINTRPSRFIKANNQIPNYSLLISRVGTYFRDNEEGNPYLYVPFVFFVKDGVVTFTHEGTVNGYDPSLMEMSEEMNSELKKIYRYGFDSLN